MSRKILALFPHTQVPLAHVARPVALGPEHLCQGDLLLWQPQHRAGELDAGVHPGPAVGWRAVDILPYLTGCRPVSRAALLGVQTELAV